DEGVAALTAAIEEQQTELTSRRSRHRELTDEVHALEQRLAFDRERLDSQSGRRKEAETEVESLRAERSDAARAIETARQRETGLRPEIEEATTIIRTRRQELNGLEQEYSALRRRTVDGEERIGRSRRLAEVAEEALSRIGEDEARVETDSLRRQAQRRELLLGLGAYGREFLESSRRLREIER